jgi:hypothetical protein
MGGELKLAIFIAAVIAAAMFNVTVEHLTGQRPAMFTGPMLGILSVKLWPGIIFKDRKPNDHP